MNKNVALSLLIIIGGISSYFYFFQKPCSKPITYHLGSFDTRFGISKATFLKDVGSMSNIWNKAAGKKVLAYDEQGSLTINLIYDERQKTTQKNTQLKANVSNIKTKAQSVKDEYAGLEDDLRSKETVYDALVREFNARQKKYNDDVIYWNNNGGAPEEEYARLQREKVSLENMQRDLEIKSKDINALVAQINEFIKKYNILVDDTNSNINTINQSAGKEFEEGLYDPTKNSIDIYEFTTEQKLKRALLHELGHALSLDHNNNPLSIMYPINQDNGLVLSADDVASLKVACKLR